MKVKRGEALTHLPSSCSLKTVIIYEVNKYYLLVSQKNNNSWSQEQYGGSIHENIDKDNCFDIL